MDRRRIVFDEQMPPDPAAAESGEPRLLRLPSFVDERGMLSVAEIGDALPFPVVRYFLVGDVPPDTARAQHAQRRSHELLSCVVGACTVEVRWHAGNAVHRLADPVTALHVPPGVWVECREFSADALLLVLCSHPYDPSNEITDFGEYRAEPGR